MLRQYILQAYIIMEPIVNTYFFIMIGHIPVEANPPFII